MNDTIEGMGEEFHKVHPTTIGMIIVVLAMIHPFMGIAGFLTWLTLKIFFSIIL
jgi:hypothetical protein|tara:strand:- start:6226 stop:6387 length:162 start_codon:yes stop_codon:yes gene_type:complete